MNLTIVLLLILHSNLRPSRVLLEREIN